MVINNLGGDFCDEDILIDTISKILPEMSIQQVMNEKLIRLKTDVPRECILTGEHHDSNGGYIFKKVDGWYFGCYSQKCKKQYKKVICIPEGDLPSTLHNREYISKNKIEYTCLGDFYRVDIWNFCYKYNKMMN